MQPHIDELGYRCKSLAWAIGGVWLLTVVPAWKIYGVAGIEAVAVSAFSCLAAGCVTFALVAFASQPRQQAFSVLLGTIVRALFALLGALVMHVLLGLTRENYLVWLVLFYLISLAVETVLM